MNVNLSGKIAIVSGAASGIGQAIANMLSANGARVVYADINLNAAEQAAGQSVGALAVKMDVSNEAEVKTAIDKVIQHYGQIDILVNNAGVNTHNHRVTIDQFPTAEWNRIMDVDLNGLFFLSRAVAKPMLAQKSGRIINIASVLGIVPARLQCSFVAAKAGVINLTRSMALELGSQGILVNCVAPGSILTDGAKQLFYGKNGKFNDRVQTLLAHIPLGRPGSVEEVACVVLFLAAPENSYMNGSILTVDGGWLAGYIREF
jgi:NAD(P)-dependent dehydrogenase (short-subunit alcohol dehydrogenase family)